LWPLRAVSVLSVSFADQRQATKTRRREEGESAIRSHFVRSGSCHLRSERNGQMAK
jgi:hypothetical protein